MDGYLGEIKMFGGEYPPKNWAFCEGQVLPINTYNQLYSIIGMTYGGDGRTTFALPDLRGRTPIGAGTGTGGLTPRLIGQKSGSERVGLSQTAMPVHNHGVAGVSGTVKCNSGTGQEKNPTGLQFGAAAGGSFNESAPTGAMAPGNVAASGVVDKAGGNNAHENMQPWLCTRYIICLNGTYPPRS